MALENGTIIDKHCNDSKCLNINDAKNNGQCLICHKLYHYTCAGVKTKTVFTCNECAQTVLSIKHMNDTLNVILAQVQSIASECKNLRNENEVLKNKLLKHNAMEIKSNEDGLLMKDNDTKHLVITDSILRDVDESKLQDTKFEVVADARVATITDNLVNYHGKSFESVTYHVATNDLTDIKDDPERITEVIDKYKVLISDTKALTNTVIVSSVCPRMDEVAEMIDPFNSALKVLCDDEAVDFIDNTPSFTLSNGDTNDGYIWRNGPYLTKPGVNCVAKNIRLHKIKDLSDVTKSYNKSAPNKQTSAYQRLSQSNIRINRNGCRYCNEPGHNTATCRHSGPVLCNTCKCRGHKTKHHQSTMSRT